MNVNMPIYSLRSFEGETDLDIVDIQLTVPDSDVEALRRKINSFKRVVASGYKAAKKLQQDLLAAFQDKHYRDVTLLLEHPLVWKAMDKENRRDRNIFSIMEIFC